MNPHPKFLNLDNDFWAHVGLVSQCVGYTSRLSTKQSVPRTSPSSGVVKVPTAHEIKLVLEQLGLSAGHLFSQEPSALSSFGRLLVDYFTYRARLLEKCVRHWLMKKDEAKELFERLKKEYHPRCPLPMNKQSGEKKTPAYFTGVVNMLIERHLKGAPCDYNPRELIVLTKNRRPFRTLARRVDGAFPGPIDPIAVWEVKEYYYTTTFGSRVADAVYESLLDGLQLAEVREEGIHVRHYLMIDDYFTWWQCGRSYLCRIIDMLHMGYLDAVLFGREVVAELPKIVRGWLRVARTR